MIQAKKVPENYKRHNRDIMPIDWNYVKVEDVMKIKNNYRIPISESERKKIQGEYPYYGPTKIQDYIDRYTLEGEHVLIGEDGDHFLKYRDKEMTLLVSGKFNVNNHAHILQGTSKCYTKWFYYSFQHKNILASITRQGVGRYKLTKEALKKIEFSLPNINEQEKIIKIFEFWDKSLELQEKLLQEKQKQKKGLMERLLTGKVRINGFNNKWNEITLNKVLVEKGEKTKINNQHPMLTSSRQGLFLQSEYFGKQVASQDNIGYKVIKKYEFTYRAMSDDGKFIFNQLTDYDIGIVSPAYSVFKVRDNSDDIFIKEILNSDVFKKHLAKKVQGGTRLTLKFKSLEKIKLKLPDKEEQVEIAKVLKTSNHEIKLLQKEINLLKEQKKGLMQLLLTGIVRVKYD